MCIYIELIKTNRTCATGTVIEKIIFILKQIQYKYYPNFPLLYFYISSPLYLSLISLLYLILLSSLGFFPLLLVLRYFMTNVMLNQLVIPRTGPLTLQASGLILKHIRAGTGWAVLTLNVFKLYTGWNCQLTC